MNAPSRITSPGIKNMGAARDRLLALGLFMAVLLAYQPAWNGQPIWDDDAHLVPPALQSWHGLEKIWFQPGTTPQYYPLTCTVFWLEQKLWGYATPGYHIVNIILHFASALLLVRVLRRLEVPGAWLAAALWALHPVQAESVAWISELKNTLSGLCYFGGALAYVRFDQERKGAFYLGSLGLFAAGLLAKSVIATLPAALLLVFWWKRKKLRWKEDALPLAPFFAAGIGLGLFTAWVERTIVIGSAPAYAPLSMLDRFLAAGRALWFYLGKLAWPHPLIFIYPRWEISAAVWWQFLFPAAGLLLAAGWWHFRRRIGPGPLVALLFFAGTLFPALGFFDLYPFRYSFVADHFQYLACLGPLALAAAAMERGLPRLSTQNPLFKPGCCALLLTVLGALTWTQCGQYAGLETLWRATLAKNPRCWMARDNLGNVLAGRGEVPQAIVQFRQALEINPADAEAHYDLGLALTRTGQAGEAVPQFQQALEIKPGFADARNNLGVALAGLGKMDEAVAQYSQALKLRPGDVSFINNLANAFFKQGRLDEAVAQYRQALLLAPENPDVNNNLGKVLLLKGDLDGAMACLQKAAPMSPDPAQRWHDLGDVLLENQNWELAAACYGKALSIQPGLADAQANLGLALLQKGQTHEAVAAWQQALALKPDLVKVQNRLAWLLATASDPALRDGAKALALASQANRLTGGGDPIILRTLAAAYAEAARYNEAVATAQKALTRAQSQNNAKLAAALQAEIRLYQSARPMRETR
jgi:tetratricopeptide (TPR) repeat protein